jgi:dipeptidase E
MGTLLLTSCGFYTNSIRNKFKELLNDYPSNLSVGIITTASEQKSNNRFAIQAKEEFLTMGFNIVEFIDVEFDDIKCLDEHDIIYINGGNPFYLLHHLKKSGADEKLKELSERDVIIVGVSAGSVILGPDIRIVDFFTPQLNTIRLKDFTGLKITDTVVFPHYDREDLFPNALTIEERLLKYEEEFQQKVLRLTDNEAVLIDKSEKVMI